MALSSDEVLDLASGKPSQTDLPGGDSSRRRLFQAATEFGLQASTAATGSGEMTDHCQVARRMIGYRMSV